MTKKTRRSNTCWRNARKIVKQLLEGIQYGDSRDNPKWQKAVLGAATRIVYKEILKG